MTASGSGRRPTAPPDQSTYGNGSGGLRRNGRRRNERQSRSPDGEGAVTGEDMSQGGDGQEGRVFPAAVGGGEQPAVRPMHRQRADEDRQKRERDPTAIEAGDDRQPADQLGRENRPGESRRQPDFAQEAGETRQG